MNHLSEEQLVLYYYGEDDASTAARAHLDQCPACREELAALQRALNVLDSAPVPERAADYGARVWRRLQPALGRNRRFALLWPVRHWAAAAAVAALMLAAFLAGRYSPRTPPLRAANTGQVRERILLVAVGDHLERSQMVLVELLNAPPGRSLDIASERARATDLVAENRLYRLTAARAGDTRVATLLDELEPVLIQIAHAPDRLSPEDLGQLRRSIQSGGILFKVRIAGSAVRHRENRAVLDAGRKNL